MPHLFVILLKINLVLLLFAATYYLVLRRLTFYVLNRCFLVLGIIFSTVYPFIDLTEFFHRQEVNNAVTAYLPQLNQTAAGLMPTGFFINNWPILSSLFYLGVLLMTCRLAIQFISLYKIHQKSRLGTVANYKVRLLKESVSPFSFWQTVYINPALHSEKELDAILAHEMVHVRQWHTLDIILAELSVVFYWFNPGVWLMKKAVKENLEFITDQNILKKGMDKKAYQYSLLGVGQLTASVAIVNNFNLSDLKKRIQMMNSKRSSKLTLSRYAFALPVLLLTTLAFTVSKKDIKKHLPQLSKMVAAVKEHKEPVVEKIEPAKLKSVKRKPALQVAKKVDTLSKIDVLVNAVYVKRDSTNEHLKHFEEILSTLKVKFNLPEDVKVTANKTDKQVFIFKSDTVNADKIARLKNIAVNFKGKITDRQNMPIEKGRVVMIRAFKTSDSLTKHEIDYVINGKTSLSDDFKKLNPSEIQRVQIIKNGDKSQIHIEMKKKAEL